MKTPSFHFRSASILAFLFAFVFHLQVYASLIDDSPPDPTIEVTEVDFDFGSVFFGTQPSQARQFFIRNVGQQALTFQVSVTNPDFMYFSNSSYTLLPGEFAVGGMAFKPGVVGVISGILSITSNDPANPVLNFSMTGIGLPSPVEETFIQDTLIETFDKVRPFKITNTSDERSEFHLEFSPRGFVQFPIDTYVLDPGESVWAELRLLGINHVGIQQTTFELSNLSIHGNILDPIFIKVELVTLEEQWGPVAYISGAHDVDFGKTFVGGTVGPLVFQIDNPSPKPLVCHLSSSDINFWIDGPDTTFVVTRNDFFSASYAFKPLTAGDFSGEIILTTNDPIRPRFVWHVQGEAIEVPFQLIEDTVHVGEQSIQTVIIRNTAPTPLEFELNPAHNDEHDSFLELSISPNRIALSPDETAAFQVSFDATDFTPGVYYGAISVYTSEYGMLNVPYVVMIIDLPQAIKLPDSIHVEIPIATAKSTSFVIENTSNTNLDYSIEAGPIASGSGTRVYGTGFEGFSLGSPLFKDGWYSASYIYFHDESVWFVEDANPFDGSHHIRGFSTAGTASDLYTPIFPIEADAIFSIDMMLDFERGVNWKISALEYTVNLMPDGSVAVAHWYNDAILLSTVLPTEYFNLRFTVNNNTNELLIAINDVVIFVGPSFTIGEAQVSFNFESEVIGATMDIDNIRFTNGNEHARLLTVEPLSGTIPPLSSHTVNLLIDARNVNAGVYRDSIIVRSSDSLAAVVSIPFEVIVKENISPELINVPDTTMIMVAGDTLAVTFVATDVDDAFVSVSGFYIDSYAAYNYHSVLASGNGYTTFGFIAPERPVDSHFTGVILAKDARGGVSSRYFVIHVLAHNENDFVLTNFKTKVELEAFTDTLVLDIARPDIDNLTIQFKTIESYFESPHAPEERDLPSPKYVSFTLDGVYINGEKSAPYYIDSWQIPKLSEGYHTLKVFADYYNDGEELGVSEYATRQVVIHVINSTFISGFDVVDLNGAKLMDLVEGSIIDLNQPEFSSFNIIANPSLSSIRSVKFALNDVTARIDNAAPYSLAGNPISGDTFWRNPKPGHYTLNAVPYMKYFAWGPKGTPLTVHFQIVKGTHSSTTIAREATSAATHQIEEISRQENILSVYPVPVADQLYIELHESVKGNVVLNILNAQGQSVHLKSGQADEFRKYSISTVQLEIRQGIYFVMLNQVNGKRIVKKFVKE